MSFLIFFGALFGVLYVFVRVFRARVGRQMQNVEMPAELVAAQQAIAARTATVKSAAIAPKPVPAQRALPAAPHFMLVYEVGPDFLQRRAQFRDEHLVLAWKAAEAGELVLAGALEEGAGQALLLFRGSREAALRFAAADPYVRHGLVKGFRVKQWLTTVGATASQPTRPGG